MRKLTFLLFFSMISTSLAFEAQDVIPIHSREYAEQVEALLKKAKESIHLIQFELRYYSKYPNSPTNRLINAMIEAHQRGIDVSVLVEKSDSFAKENSDKNEQAASRLQEVGIKVYFDSPNVTTHDKVLVIDDQVVIGSTNWTYHAMEKNNESSALIRSKELADYYRSYFQSLVGS